MGGEGDGLSYSWRNRLCDTVNTIVLATTQFCAVPLSSPNFSTSLSLHVATSVLGHTSFSSTTKKNVAMLSNLVLNKNRVQFIFPKK